MVQIVDEVSTLIHLSMRGQGHCLTFVQGHSDLYFQTYFQAAGHISQISCESFMIRGSESSFK